MCFNHYLFRVVSPLAWVDPKAVECPPARGVGESISSTSARGNMQSDTCSYVLVLL